MINLVKIENFKSFQQVEVEMPFFGAIVGRNAAGKSNLLQAINYTRHLVMGLSTKILFANNNAPAIEILHLNSNSKTFTIGVHIESTRNSKKYYFEYSASLNDEGEFEISNEVLKVLDDGDENLIFQRKGHKVINGENKEIPLATNPGRLILSSYEHPDVRTVTSEFSSTLIMNTDVHMRSSYAPSIHRQDSLVSLISRLKTHYPDRYEYFEKMAKKLLPNFTGFSEIKIVSEDQKDKEKYLFLLQENHLSDSLSMTAASSGDYKTMLLLARALTLKNGSLFIEEIENGMHPKRIDDLVEILEAISRTNNLQVLFTTHHPDVINRFPPHRIIYVAKSDTGSNAMLLSSSKQIEQIKKLLSKDIQLSNSLDYLDL